MRRVQWTGSGRRRTLRVCLGALGALGVVLLPAIASAHPLGNFTVNRYSGIEIGPERVQVAYVLDMAEIPTQQEQPRLDADGDDRISSEERAAWASRRAAELADGVRLQIDGRRVTLEVVCSSAQLGDGQAGLPVLRLDAGFAAAVPERGAVRYEDENDPGRIGWREITVAGVDGVAISGSSVPASSRSDALRRYPQDLLSSPLDERASSFSYAPGATESTSSAACVGSRMPATDASAVSAGGFADLIRRDLTPAVLALSLLLAIGFGALHALGPGHGKTLMAAYLVGSDAKLRQATAVGGAVALMHTASVLAIGLVVLSLERTFSPERIYPWLGLASGLVALGLGAALLVGRLTAWANHRRTTAAGPHHEHEHEHDGSAAHDHGLGAHRHPVPGAPVLSRKGLTALAVAGGILPSPTALIVLLSAVSFHRVAFGLALIGAFSIGLAGALVLVGIAAMRARDAVAVRLASGIGRLVPVLSAAAIVGVGLFLTLRAVVQI